MSGHVLIVESWWPTLVARCDCDAWSIEHPTTIVDLRREHAIHAEAMRAEAEQLVRGEACDWYRRTGICHSCGQPGNWCQCSDAKPCGCRELHPMGSGIGVNPADVFADAPVSDGQGELFSQ